MHALQLGCTMVSGGDNLHNPDTGALHESAHSVTVCPAETQAELKFNQKKIIYR